MKPEPWCCKDVADPCCIDIAEVVDYSLIGRSSKPAVTRLLHRDWWRQYQVPWPVAEVGDWAVRRYEIKPAWAALHNLNHPDVGLHVTPGEYTKLMFKNRDVVMSDTQAEIQDHLEFIDRAHGRVLINGLGLGVSLRAILMKHQGGCVEHVDVVEIEQDVIDLIGPHFADDSRVTIHQADAYTVTWPRNTRWHVAWHDIWPSIDPDELAQHTRLLRKYSQRVNWQGCWKHDWMVKFARWEKEHSRRRDEDVVGAYVAS
jgi:hypothetical protein